MARVNTWGQPIGPDVGAWTTPPVPARSTLTGRYSRVEPLDVERHAKALWEAYGETSDARRWTYLPYGPFETFESYVAWLRGFCLGADPLFFAIVDADTEAATGVASYMRIFPTSGSVEVGHLNFSARLAQKRAATDAMFLMMKNAFELGYRRYEWKCDALNQPSRSAAERLGFSFEGVFRNATVNKGMSRDTAWYSLIQSEWPALEGAFSAWLDPANFDDRGVQRKRLSELVREVRAG